MESSKDTLTTRERFLRCLDFKPVDRAPFLETFGAEDIARWEREGFPKGVDFNQFFGLDDLRAIAWVETPLPPFQSSLLEDKKDSTIEQIADGSIVERSKHISFQHVITPPIASMGDWEAYRPRLMPDTSRIQISPEALSKLRADQSAGKCAMRSWMSGFFAYPRTLLGPEQHLMAFLETPELIKAICDHWVKFSTAMIEEATSLVEIDYFLIGEDISYKNGPFISAGMFREFLEPAYRQVISLLRSKNVSHIFIDTDGDFFKLIPLYLEMGIDGFLPVEVQAGMQVSKIRKDYPRLRFIGGVDKRKLYGDPKELDRHLHEEIKPVVKQGGYLPGIDHGVPRETSLAQYQYYLQELRSIL